MHNILIQDLSTMLIFGSLFGWIFKKIFKLPLILGYICAGIFIHIPIPHIPMIVEPNIAHNLAEIGILLLLFSMGLHFGLRKIQSLGISVIFVCILQALCMFLTGKYLLTIYGIPSYQALFLSAAIATSATSVVIKTLDDFQLKSHRFAEKLMGVLLIEDALAIFIIIWLTALGTAKEESTPLINFVPVFLGSILAWWILGTILVPQFIRTAYQAGREELLVILCIGLALGLAYMSSSLNFSPALGAFIMGSILSECREIRKIVSLIEPVKNIFALVFFVSVGLLFSPSVVFDHWKMIAILVATVITGKVFYNFIYNLIFGQGLKDSLRMAGSMGQIGELSFVIAQVGKSFGVISEEYFSSIVAVAVFTMLSTPFVLKVFLIMADKSDNILPKPITSFLDDYTRSLFLFSLDKKVAPIFKKFSFLKSVKFLAKLIQHHVRKNYMLVTSKNVTSTFNRLAPWDEYLVPVHVDYNTGIVGKNLLDLKLRERFNINVVAIGRDMETIVSPKPTDIIMGGDTLLVYGNEESVSKLEEFSNTKIENEKSYSIDECILGRIVLDRDHSFVGKSILELGIRNLYNCIILAINRNDERIKNPMSSFVFQAEDEIFIFGTKTSIDSLNMKS